MPIRSSRTRSDGLLDDTNTYALLVPHPALFTDQILDLLRDFYSKFGEIVHWAPVKGLGRVILVWENHSAGRIARQGGAGTLSISSGADTDSDDKSHPDSNEKPHRSNTALTFRLFALPPTSTAILEKLYRDPQLENATQGQHDPNHLVPPEYPRNFLVSPPGSPPEGWEPIMEDAPNEQTLATDLAKALQSLELNLDGNSIQRRKWIGQEQGDETDPIDPARNLAGEVILQTDTGTVFAVQSPDSEDEGAHSPPVDREHVEYVSTGFSGVRQVGSEKATVESMMGTPGSSGQWRNPGLDSQIQSSRRPMPTARPPVP